MYYPRSENKGGDHKNIHIYKQGKLVKIDRQTVSQICTKNLSRI